MGQNGKEQFPYKLLGTCLKKMREKLRQTLDEVSGAVEIDTELLNKYELGAARPSEDILLLIISHFGAKEQEALKLWELADFDKDQLPTNSIGNDHQGLVQSTVVVLPQDARILFTDLVNVVVNKYGVVINFLQGNSGASNQPMIVSRVGMSREHALSMVDVLQKALNDQPKGLLLPSPRKSKTKNKKSDQSS